MTDQTFKKQIIYKKINNILKNLHDTSFLNGLRKNIDDLYTQ